jgi:hypothetical protein
MSYLKSLSKMNVSVRYTHQIRRLNKAKQQSLYLLDYTMSKDKNLNSILEFKICGSTKNIYTVTLKDRQLKCDCPDNFAGCRYFNIICKHSCFVLCKVLKGSESIFEPLKNHNNMIINDHNMKNILNEFSKLNDRIQNQTISKKDLIDKYKKIQELEENSNSNEPYKSKFKYTGDLSEKHESDVCGICFNELKLDILMAMCPDCHNIVHINCMKKWMNMGKDTCVYCRSSIWKNYKKEEMKEKGIKPVEEKYKSLDQF